MDEPDSAISSPSGSGVVGDPPGTANKPVPLLFRDLMDWMWLVAAIGLATMLWLSAQDLWFRTDLRFFPGLVAISLVLIIRNAKLGICEASVRQKAAFGICLLSATFAVLAALVVSPWTAGLALLLLTIAWLLYRFGDLAWHQVVGWTLPVWVIGILPNSDASDLTLRLEQSVASSTSAVLDVIGIPQLCSGKMIEFEHARLSASIICRGIGNPYLLLSLVILLAMLNRRSFGVGLMSAATVPLWSWVSGVIHLTVGIYVWNIFGRNLVVGYRNIIVQCIVLSVTLVGVWLFQSSLSLMLSPFKSHSQNVGWVHKLFNLLGNWPRKDPLRQRHKDEFDDLEEDEAEAEIPQEEFWSTKPVQVTLIVATLAFAIAGGLCMYAVTAGQAANRLVPLSITGAVVENSFREDSLPEELGGLRRIGYEVVDNPDTYFSEGHSINWIYAANLKRFRFSVVVPRRGFYPIEWDLRSPLRKFAKPRESYQIEVGNLGQVLIDEIELLDDLYGRAYTCYATLTLNNVPPFRTGNTEAELSVDALATSLALQPTVANVQLFVESAGVLNDDERAGYRDLVAEACSLLANDLKSLVGGQVTSPAAAEAEETPSP